ncbi:MAG: hypothetical protein LLG45_02360 [Actinomycetia bacterium]|nr:hypothetical protein [Actinomycetes bacterium]
MSRGDLQLAEAQLRRQGPQAPVLFGIDGEIRQGPVKHVEIDERHAGVPPVMRAQGGPAM